MKITDIYQNKKNVLSFEIFPPKKDEELKNIDATLEILADLKPDYISVTFGAGGSSNNNKTIAIAKQIKEVYHIEPVVHLTCLCYDKQEIDEFSKVLKAEGIENILALRGDKNPNLPEKHDFAHASDLITYLKDKYPMAVEKRFNIEERENPTETLELIAKARGCYKKGQEIDYTKAASILMDEFRAGKLGKMTLEYPEVSAVE